MASGTSLARRLGRKNLMYEYLMEHYGAVEPCLDTIKQRVGIDVFESKDYVVSIESSSSIIVAISRTDESRVAFAKTIEYLLTISDSVVVHDL